LLEHDEAAGGREPEQQVAHRRPGRAFADRQTAAMDVETGERLDGALFDEEDGKIRKPRLDNVGQGTEGSLGQQHRPRPERRRRQ
jgi:hypothetical protein